MKMGRSSYKWISLAAASLLAAALAGCNGGGSSSSGDSGGAAPPVTGGTTPAGNAVVTAAAANPAATNTAANPNQAFGLIVDAGGSPVVIQSPPVVIFAVIDSAGKHVPGLTLFNANGASADPNCSGNNVTFAIAKFDGSNWQSLISRQRLAANTATQFAVVEGTTDPKPTATLTNPATAASDSSTRVVGILEENAAGGYYTYRFAMDVSTPLLMANAVAGKNFASTSTAVNKIANNGNLAVKDGKTIHRVGVQLCYTDPASKAKVVVNPYIDFTLGADGVAVPVKASDGKTLAAYRKVVDKDSCNECHATLTAHGTRVDPNYCVICHNPGSTDYHTNNPVDFKLMIHKFHMGTGSLPEGQKGLSKDYTVAEFTARATDPVTGAVSGPKYPQTVQNCVKCHDGSATATHKTAQGDNWKTVPSRNACGACHDGIDFATGKGATIGSTYPGHIGGAQSDDSKCVLCHDATGIPVYHKDTMPSTADASKRTMSATISKVAVGATDGSVTVTFSVTDNGVPVTDKTKFTSVSFALAKLAPAANGSSTHWVSYTSRFRTKDATKAPVLQGNKETNGTLSANSDGTFSYKFALDNASTPGDIRTISHAHVLRSVGPTTATTIGTWTWNPTAKTWTEATTTGGANTGPNTVAYEPTLTHRVAMEFQKVGTTNVDNATNAYFDFVPAGGAVTSTRNIVTMNNCSVCHGGVKLHEGYATELCVTCHNQGTSDPFTGATVDLQTFVHKLHRGKDLPSVVAGGSYKINGIDFGKGTYPGNIKDCAVCHKETATKADGTTLLENAANWRTTPTKRACGSCHDSTDATTHIESQIYQGVEQCTFCHGATTTFGLDVKSVHSK